MKINKDYRDVMRRGKSQQAFIERWNDGFVIKRKNRAVFWHKELKMVKERLKRGWNW